MSQPALRGTSELPPVAPADDAVGRYAATTYARFERVLVTELAGLSEPRTADPERALRRVPFLVETLAGHAHGVALGQVATAVRRGFAGPIGDAITAQLGAITRRTGPIAVSGPSPRRFLADAHRRPLLDQLGGHLHVRLGRSVGEVRVMLRGFESAVTRISPDQRAAFTRTLDLLAADDTSGLGFADHVVHGWQTLCAVLTGGREPTLPASRDPLGRICDGWRAWADRVRGHRAVRTLDHAAVVRAGYVLRVG